MAKTVFIDGDEGLGIEGTAVSAEYLNKSNNHHHTGIDGDGEGALPYALDSGAADAYVVDLAPALTELILGMAIMFKAGHANTGASTLNVNGLGIKPIKKSVTLALEAGDIVVGQLIQVSYDGANFQILGSKLKHTHTSAEVPALPYIKVADIKASGTDGGTFTSGAWRKRDINTEDFDAENLCALAANQITLKAGTYECLIHCPALQVDANRAQLYNVTGGAVLISGENSFATNYILVVAGSSATIRGRFTLAIDSVLEIRHRCSQTRNDIGFGSPCSFGDNEVYTVAEFWKVG
jgi:hypothetical protein